MMMMNNVEDNEMMNNKTIHLQLGDVIRIHDPENETINNKLLYVDYIDEHKIHFIEMDKEMDIEKTHVGEKTGIELELGEKEVKGKIILEEDSDEEIIVVPIKQGIKTKEQVEERINEERPNTVAEEKINVIQNEIVPVVVKKGTKKNRIQQPQGVAELKGKIHAKLGDTRIEDRMPKREQRTIPLNPYIMNNRETFINFINALFEPYKHELQQKDNISCENIGKTAEQFNLLTHQLIVRDYMNLYTPYRGLLLYHGLGSGKTCTSIAIAEGMKDSKQIIILTPASLRANYVSELKKCGDLMYKKNQYWEWISLDKYPEALPIMSSLLNLPQEYITKNKGAFFVNVKKPSNYDDAEFSDEQKEKLEDQLNEMIHQKYKFINYNGLRAQKLVTMTDHFKTNIFDNNVIIIDEAHNFISRIVNKLKKERKSAKREKEQHVKDLKPALPASLSLKLYEMLLSAKNARIILLSGTPVINYPNEFAILFNLLRGYIKTWTFLLEVETTEKVDVHFLRQLFINKGLAGVDYLDYSPTSKIMTVTKNPFGFYNVIDNNNHTHKKEYKGVVRGNEQTDEEFEQGILNTLASSQIRVNKSSVKIRYQKALPDVLEDFLSKYIDDGTKQLKNTENLKRRILGLSSYFRSAQENLLPRFQKQLGVDYHVEKINMSNIQFKEYETIRIEERTMEKKRPTKKIDDEYKEKTSTYRIFSRLICNYAIPGRPFPEPKKASGEEEEEEEEEEHAKKGDGKLVAVLKQGNKVEKQQDLDAEQLGEIEGDEVLQKVGGQTYIEMLNDKLRSMSESPDEYFSEHALSEYSPKFLQMLQNIQNEEHVGLHLIYSQFRTAEGIGLFTYTLNYHGFCQFKIRKDGNGIWKIDISPNDRGKKCYALYTGTETVEEKEIMRNIYNGEWENIPDSISSELRDRYVNNKLGEVIKVFMITSSGSEGINLRNTRFVHLMDPYWHPVRFEQVIGRARRICSHKDLPEDLQNVEVFVYLMTFTEEQVKSDMAKELRKHDVSKITQSKRPITSDEYLFEIAEMKATLIKQMTDVIKQSSFDCNIYSGEQCMNFNNPNNTKYTYVPNYEDQPEDNTVYANKREKIWDAVSMTINGTEYAARRMGDNMYYLYDIHSYQAAVINPSVVPVLVYKYTTDPRGKKVLYPPN